MDKVITIMDFYPNRYWFFYFKKMKYIKGFTIRVFGINIMVKEDDSFNKLLQVWNVHRLLRQNGIKYK